MARSATGGLEGHGRALGDARDPAVPQSDDALGAKITTRMATTPTISAWCSQWVDTISRTMMKMLVPTSGPSSVPAPPTIAHTTASPDTW